MNKTLPEKPNLDQLRRQAKELEKAFQARDPQAVDRVSAIAPAAGDKLPHHYALFVIAREYGFSSWPRLKARVDELNRSSMSLDDLAKLFVEAATDRRVSEAVAIRQERPEVADYDLSCAALCGNRALISDRLSRKPELINQKVGHKQWEPLLYACYSALLHWDSPFREEVKQTALWLLEQGADPNAHWHDTQWKCDEYCLYGATGVNNCPELAEALLQAGAEVNDNESLYHSTELPDSACLEVLIRHGVRTDRTNGLGRAMDHHRTDYVRMLLEHGADPNEGLNQSTPLLRHALIRGAPTGIFEAMIEHGAKDWTTHFLSSSYAFAHWLGRQDVIDLMDANGLARELRVGDRFLYAAARGDLAEQQRIRSEHPNILQELPFDWSEAIRRAAELGYADRLRNMIAAGLDPNVPGGQGDTGLHWACWYGRADVVEILLQHGAPVDLADKNHGGTPLGWAAFGSTHCRSVTGAYHNPTATYPTCARLLLEAGAVATLEHFGDASDDVVAVFEEYR